MIGIVCSYAGFCAAGRLKKRRDTIRGFIASLKAAETEILFGRTDLREIFKRLSAGSCENDFFGACAKYTGELGIRQAWSRALNETTDMLKNDEKEVIRSLGSELGMSDVEGQKRAIERVCGLLERAYDEANGEYMRLGGVYRKCGVLCGAFVVIVLL